MEIASGTENGGIASTSPLPSLFVDHQRINGLHDAKDLDALMSMNDTTLSQQIEFILQDAPMDQDEIDAVTAAAAAADVDVEMSLAKVAANASVSVSACTPLAETANPPTIADAVNATSASDYQTCGAKDEHPTSAAAAGHPAVERERLLNGRRRIIIQTTTATTKTNATTTAEAATDADDLDHDPELNDENLKDIEEEDEAEEQEEEEDDDDDDDEEEEEGEDEEVEGDEEEGLEVETSGHFPTDIKLEHDEDDYLEDGANIEYVTTSSIALAPAPTPQPQIQQQHQQQQLQPQLVQRTVSVPASEALVQLQRRPAVYISSAPSGIAGATFVRMPAVIRSSPMAVLNVVQPSGGASQLILQAAPLTVTAQSAAPAAVVEVTTTATSARTNPPQRAITSNASVGTEMPSTSAAAAAAATTTTVPAPPAPPPPPQSFQCVECAEKFDTKELFDIHRSGHANNMKCAICNMVLKSLKNYEKHCLRCKPYECQICGRIVRFRPNFIKHMRVHTGQQSERHKYKCEVCHKEFMSFEYFKVHKKIHNENVNLTCEICGKVFSALASLRGHSKLHSGVKLHKCEVCGKGFGQRYNLKIHARTHTGDFPFECKLCKKKLHTQSSLQTHMQIHQRNQTQGQTSRTTTASAGQAASSKGETVVAAATTVTRKTRAPATIVKMEPQGGYDGPSTSAAGYQQFQDAAGNIITATAARANFAEESSNGSSSNTSHELQQQQQQQQQQLLVSGQATRTIVIKNYAPASVEQTPPPPPLSAQQAPVIQQQQQQLRKTPIIHSTGGAVALANVVQRQGVVSPAPTPTVTSSSSVVVSGKAGVVPLTLNAAAIGTSTIRSTRHPHLQHAMATGSLRNNHHHHQQQQQQQQREERQREEQRRRQNHRNHHRRRQLADLDDEDDDEEHQNHVLHQHQQHRHEDDDDDEEEEEEVVGGEQDLDEKDLEEVMRGSLHDEDEEEDAGVHLQSLNGHHFDDDDEEEADEKPSPSLATAAIIKLEPNFYSSGSGDNSNDMLIKEEVMFDDSDAGHSPHSPPSSKFRMSNFDSDLVVDHHVMSYGNLFEQHTIPDTMPSQLYSDDVDFRLDHSSLGGLHNTSNSTTDGDFIKKEWVYGATSGYSMNGKFDDDNDALCDAANFIYN